MIMTSYPHGVYPQRQQPLFWQGRYPQPLRQLSEDSEYRYVTCTNRHYQKPPSNFFIELSHCDNNPNTTTCRPGSIIEGIVHLSLESPIAAQYVKLVFKAAEHIHNDGSSNVYKKKGERLFAIRTFLWGKHTTEATNKWPVIEAGEYRIPFMCELPMVNYPPSYSHDLASCEFELVATIERPGIRPFQTPPCHVRYEPYIMCDERLIPEPYHETIDIGQDLKAVLTLPSGCGINLSDPAASAFQFNFEIIDPYNKRPMFEAAIVRKMEVRYGSRRRKDSMVMCQAPITQSNVQLDLPTEQQFNPKSYRYLGMTTSLSFSRFISIDYQLCITYKVKHGLISSKKQLFCVPLCVGTLPPGTYVPSSISYYRDPHVISDNSLLTKPKFLKHIRQEEQLPAYSADAPPPSYVSV